MKKLLNKRKKRRRLFVLVGLFLLLFVGIGYAYLRETLTINSNTEISSMKWDVHFENIKTKSGSITPTSEPTIGTDKLSITTSLNFTQPGQFYEYTVDVKNDGTIDAMIESFDDTVLTEEQQKYLIYTANYIDDSSVTEKQLLKAGKKETIRVRIVVKEDLQKADLPTSGDELKIKFKLNYVQADDTAVKKASPIILPTDKTKDTLAVGDEICIKGETTECFNFIRYDGDNIVMLSKWNLNVGANSSGEETFKQNSSALGAVRFSASNYWANLDLTYPADVYDNTYKTVPDFSASGYQTEGYSIAYYVEEYKKILEDYGATVKNARLLPYSEATDSSIGCSISASSCPTGFIRNTIFWLGSIRDANGVLCIDTSGYFGSLNYYYDTISGVRPVIEIAKSDV